MAYVVRKTSSTEWKSLMSNRSPVIFIHGFIGTFVIREFETAYAAPHLLGYGEHRTVPFDQIE